MYDHCCMVFKSFVFTPPPVSSSRVFLLPFSLFNQEIVSNRLSENELSNVITYPKCDLGCGLLSCGCVTVDLQCQLTVVWGTAWPNSMTCGSVD